MVKNLIGGLAGAIALNAVHQLAKKIDPDAPEINKIGEEALSKTILAAGYTPPVGKALFKATLASDVAANAIYYSLIGQGGKKHLMLRGALLGAAAGVGALKLAKPMGLDDKPVNKTGKTKLMTVGWYLLGGMVTALTIKALGRGR
jgi:hypothetical protein